MRIIVVIAIAAGLITSGCSSGPQSRDDRAQTVSGVRTEQVAYESIPAYYEASGTVRARSAALLSAQIVGRVTSVRVREGQRVKAGQVLLEIDNRDAIAHLNRAQAAVRHAENGVLEADQAINVARAGSAAAAANRNLAATTLARYQNLQQRNSVSPQEFDEVKSRHEVAAAEADRAEKMLQVAGARRTQAQSQLDQATAELTTARIQSGYTQVVSPITGIIISKQVEVGAIATPGVPLLTVEDSQYHLEVSVSESQIRTIRVREPATVHISSISSDEMTGTVIEILPAADPASRSYLVKIGIPQTALIRSGLYGKARFISGQRRALVVPSSAIVERGQLTGVFVVDESSTVRLRLVTTGKTTDGRVEILSGLNEGERIAMSDVTRLSDGSRLK